jgi:anaerobic ribonucleoside-triphosphate reductase activating protein
MRGKNNMNYHDIKSDNMDNGDGVRTVIWLSGCKHCCKECQNQQTWNPDSGKPFDMEAEGLLFDYIGNDYCSGITFTGGDPLHPNNRAKVLELMKKIKDMYPDKTIWIYTGYVMHKALRIPEFMDMIKYIDVLVDGKYIDELRDTTLMWRGSKNQLVIDMQATLNSDKIVSHIPLEKQVQDAIPDITKIVIYK